MRVPSGVTGVELRAIKEAAESAGVFTIEEPLVAAVVGAGPLAMRPLDERLRRETSVPGRAADEGPIRVAVSSGRCLEEIKYYCNTPSSG